MVFWYHGFIQNYNQKAKSHFEHLIAFDNVPTHFIYTYLNKKRFSQKKKVHDLNMFLSLKKKLKNNNLFFQWYRSNWKKQIDLTVYIFIVFIISYTVY
jgi:hypothetical protein